MKKFFKPAVALLLCAVMVLGILPTAMAAQTDGKRSYSRLADLSQLEEQYLSESEARSAEYPNYIAHNKEFFKLLIKLVVDLCERTEH